MAKKIMFREYTTADAKKDGLRLMAKRKNQDLRRMSLLLLRRPQKNAVVGIARSLTMESMKLPSISTSSVITTATNGTTGGASIKTTGSGSKKVNIQVLIHFARWRCGQLDSDKGYRESQLNAALSKSLPNIATSVPQDTKASVAAATKHRFEKFAHTKKLSRRTDEIEKEDDGQHLEQSGV
ncbi:uncharacterized protein LOC110453985 isoform X3 [Mizuhopecten yessoensis]|uniref:uncharacterized protein LOC110453985 isoform X3 n=1 Tax=Mizuhopecten yessoensis TaxID=6573 RepID=UPI000B45E0C1|nr:uncharacterized protein LOC110453985 isoform X3 [Mizuhopecten yessoensis]